MSQPSTSSFQERPLQASRLATGVLPDEDPSSASSSSSSSASISRNPLAPSTISSSAHRLAEGRMPCARRSYLLGLGAGVGIAAIRMVTGKSFKVSANWGAGAFVLVSVSSWEMCRRSLAAEQQRMKMVIQHHQRKSAQRASANQSVSQDRTATSPEATPSPPPSRII